VKVHLSDIRSSYEGFAKLSDLARKIEDCFLDEIDIDMSCVRWFDANMCAATGAILYRASQSVNNVVIGRIRDNVETILRRNGFLANYGYPAIADTFRTTIRYNRFGPGEDRRWASYVNEHLRGKGMPRMTRALRKKLVESVLEVFSNAAIHSRTKLGIFSCGQFFPKKERLDFSVADLGIGIRRNILEKKNIDLPAEQAIRWAVSERNTTKTGSVPGGSGLKILREFLSMNGGRIQIISDRGYWEFCQGEEVTERMASPFPGTVVNLEFNTADTNSYCLSSEMGSDDIL